MSAFHPDCWALFGVCTDLAKPCAWKLALLGVWASEVEADQAAKRCVLVQPTGVCVTIGWSLRKAWQVVEWYGPDKDAPPDADPATIYERSRSAMLAAVTYYTHHVATGSALGWTNLARTLGLPQLGDTFAGELVR